MQGNEIEGFSPHVLSKHQAREHIAWNTCKSGMWQDANYILCVSKPPPLWQLRFQSVHTDLGNTFHILSHC